MPSRLVFPMDNGYFQGGFQGICTVASLQWAKKCLQLRRGLGSFDELGLDGHQLNALMAVWRRYDDDPAGQTSGMGLRMVGVDHHVTQFIDVQRLTNLTAPHTCIFWTDAHTMGYRVSTQHGRECEFFDIEQGLWLADNDTDIRQVVLPSLAAYGLVRGMRIVDL